jgi:hypothetical protein
MTLWLFKQIRPSLEQEIDIQRIGKVVVLKEGFVMGQNQ